MSDQPQGKEDMWREAIIALIPAGEIDDAISDFDPRGRFEYLTPGKCLLCDVAFDGQTPPHMDWIGLVFIRSHQHISIFPLHEACTRGKTHEVVHRALIDALQVAMIVGEELGDAQVDTQSLAAADAADEPDQELTIHITPEVKAQMEAMIAKHPGAADQFKSLFAAMHQAHQAAREGRYQSFDDAMEAITGNRPERIDPDNQDDDDG